MLVEHYGLQQFVFLLLEFGWKNLILEGDVMLPLFEHYSLQQAVFLAATDSFIDEAKITGVCSILFNHVRINGNC